MRHGESKQGIKWQIIHIEDNFRVAIRVDDLAFAAMPTDALRRAAKAQPALDATRETEHALSRYANAPNSERSQRALSQPWSLSPIC